MIIPKNCVSYDWTQYTPQLVERYQHPYFVPSLTFWCPLFWGNIQLLLLVRLEQEQSLYRPGQITYILENKFYKLLYLIGFWQERSWTPFFSFLSTWSIKKLIVDIFMNNPCVKFLKIMSDIFLLFWLKYKIEHSLKLGKIFVI